MCLVRVPGDARRFFSGSADRTVRLWCLDDGSCLATLRGHTGSVSSVLITSTAVLTGSSDCSVRCWSRIDHKVVRVIHGHSDAVRALAPHHTRVRATVCHRVPLCVRVLLDCRRVHGRVLPPQDGYPLVFTASGDGCIRSWDLARGVERQPMHSARSTWPNVVDGGLKGLCVVTQLTSYVLTLPLEWPTDGGASNAIQLATSYIEFLSLLVDPLQLVSWALENAAGFVTSLLTHLGVLAWVQRHTHDDSSAVGSLETVRWATAVACTVVRGAVQVPMAWWPL